MVNKKWDYIRIWKKTKVKLKRLKIHPNQSYSEVIEKLLDCLKEYYKDGFK